MGFLSKLFGNEGASSAAKDFLKDVLQETVNNKTPWQQGGTNTVNTVNNGNVGSVIPQQGGSYNTPSAENAPFGVSWGDRMPDEPNQYNFNGSYDNYFETVFREAFGEYQIEKQLPANRRAAIFTFSKDGRRVLAVEVISQSSSPYKTESDCIKQGMGYLRYYHDHHGWWNTKNYVINRTRACLNAHT